MELMKSTVSNETKTIFKEAREIEIIMYVHQNPGCRYTDLKKGVGMSDSTIHNTLKERIPPDILIKEGERKSTTYHLNYENPETQYIIRQQSVKPKGTCVYGLGTVDYTEDELYEDGQQTIKGDLNIDINIIAPESPIVDELLNDLKDDDDMDALSQYYMGIFRAYVSKMAIAKVTKMVKNGEISRDEAMKKTYEIAERIMREPFAIHMTNRGY